MPIKNREGALYMATGIDNSGLYSGLKQAENQIDGFENFVKQSGQRIGTAIGVGFGVAALKNFASEVINVRGEIQMLETSFDVLLGGKGVSVFMSELKQYAVDSPLSLTGVSNAAQTLLGFGVAAEKIIPTIKQIGDISMGNEERFRSLSLAFAQMSATGKLMGQDLLQMINAGFNPLQVISEKTGKSIGELKKDMESGAISAEMITEAFEIATAEGGKFYGMTQKQAEGIRGLQAQLEGGLQDAFNNIGKSQDDLITGGYKVAISLVENYEKVGKSVVALITTYGAYKAALMLSVQAEAGWNVAQLITYNRLLLVEKAQKLLNATMLANPYVLVATLTIGIATAMWALHDSTTEQEKAQKRLNEQLEKAESKKQGVISKSNSLIAILNDETQTIYAQTKAWKELQETIPEAFKGISLEEAKKMSPEEMKVRFNKAVEKKEIDDITNAYIEQKKVVDQLNNSIEKERQRKRDNKSGTYSGKEYDLEKIYKKELAYLDELSKKVDDLNKIRDEAKFNALPEEERLSFYKKQLDELEKQRDKVADILMESEKVNDPWSKFNWQTIRNQSELDTLNTKIKGIQGSIDALTGKTSSDKNKAYWENIKKDAESALSGMDESMKGGKDWSKEVAKLNEANRKLKIWDFTDKSKNKQQNEEEKRLAAQERFNDKLIQLGLENEAAKLSLMEDGKEKRLKEVDREYEETIAKVRKNQRELIDAYNESKGLKGKDQVTDESFKDRMPEAYMAINEAEIQAEAVKKNKKTQLNKEYQRELDSIMEESRSHIKSDLDNQLADIDRHYDERIKAAKKAGATIRQIQELESNRESKKNLLKDNDKIRSLELEMEYSERAMEMSEKRYAFEADREADLLKLKIENQKKYIGLLNKMTAANPNDADIAGTLKNAELDLTGFNKELEKTKAKKFQQIAGYVLDIAGALGGVNEELAEATQFASSILQGFTQGGAIGAVVAAASFMISKVVDSIGQQQQAEIESLQIRSKILTLQEEYNQKLRDQNYELISSIDYLHIFRDNLEALNWLVQRGFVPNVDLTMFEALNGQIEESGKNLDESIGRYEYYVSEIGRLGKLIGSGPLKDLELKEAFDKAISGGKADEILKVLDTMLASGSEYTIGGRPLQDVRNDFAGANEEVIKWTETLAEARTQLFEMMAGVDYSGFLDSAMNAIVEYRKGISDLGDFTEETLTNALVNSFKYKMLESAIEPFYERFANLFMADELDAEAINKWSQDLESVLKEYADKIGVTMDSLGLDFDSKSSQSSTRGGFEAMAQDQAGELTGRFTGVYENGLRIESILKIMLPDITKMRELGIITAESALDIKTTLNDCIGLLRKIADNTNELYEINEKLGKIENNTATLRGR